MAKIPCFCENIIDVDFPALVDLSVNPEKEEEILNGTFMNVTCDACGKVLKPELPVRIVDPKRDIDIFLVPELDRYGFLWGKTSYKTGSRAVIGYPELVEKIRIFRLKLDDRVIEMLKYPLLQKIDPKLDVKIYLGKKTGESLSFEIHGLKPGEVGIVNIPLEAYAQVAKDIDKKSKEAPYKEILTPPYVSIQKNLKEDDPGENR